jgi:hypothetical protein
MKIPPQERKPPGEKPELSRTDQARDVAQEYADDQRAIIEKLRKSLN